MIIVETCNIVSLCINCSTDLKILKFMAIHQAHVYIVPVCQAVLTRRPVGQIAAVSIDY